MGSFYQHSGRFHFHSSNNFSASEELCISKEEKLIEWICGFTDTLSSGCDLSAAGEVVEKMTRGCHSSCGAVLLSSLDATVE